MNQSKQQSGFVLVLVIVLSATFLTIGLTIADLVGARYQSSKHTAYVEAAILAADAGVTATLNRISSEPNFTGYSTNRQLYSDETRGKAEYSTTVTYNNTAKLFIIRSKGYAYLRPGDTTPTNTKSVEVTASLATTPISARMAVGSGGLVVNGGKIGGKNIYVNGKVTINNGYIGATGWWWLSPTSDTALNVANIGCGDASNYPVKCTGPVPGTGEPIQITGTSAIYGTVCANNQVSGANIFPGQGGTGLIVKCSAPSVTMPRYDRKALFDSMTQTKPGFTCNQLWGANSTKQDLTTNTIYTSDITIGSWSNCNPIIQGNVYIRGNLNTSSLSGMQVADVDANGKPITSPPIVAAEGTINIAGNWGNIQPNSYGIGVIFISFKSSNTDCNTDPSCNSLSPSDLYSSVNMETVVGSGDFRATESIFYSYFGTVNIISGTVGAVAGQRVLLQSDGNWSGLLQGGINKDSFPAGDAFNGNVRQNVWNIINYRQIYP